MPSPRQRAVALSTLSALLLAAAALPPGALAASGGEGIGVTPPEVAVEDAQPGQAYQRSVTVQNPNERTLNVTLNRTGEVGAWTTTAPAGFFRLPANAQQVVNLTIAVPQDAYVGLHQGQVCVTADARDAPQGSGSSLLPSICVLLNVTVGGEPMERIAWLDARAEDVEVGTAPQVFARVANQGNVRSEATVTATIRAAQADTSFGEATGAVDIVPGESKEVRLPFADSLPEGQYVARVTAEGVNGTSLDEELHFKVLPPGALGKDGRLRYIQHEPWVEAGLPVKVSAVFENTGRVSVAQAKFKGEVSLDGQLVAVLESDALVVPVGSLANLTAFFTPGESGTYTIKGTVHYDGFQTPASESILNVRASGDGGGAGGGVPWLPVLAVLGLAALVAVPVLLKKRGEGGE